MSIWHIKGTTAAGFATVVLITAQTAHEAVAIAAAVLVNPAVLF